MQLHNKLFHKPTMRLENTIHEQREKTVAISHGLDSKKKKNLPYLMGNKSTGELFKYCK